MINRHLRTPLLLIALGSLSVLACKQDASGDQDTATATKTEASAQAEAATSEAPKAEAPKAEAETTNAAETDSGDYLHVHISHAEPKPGDPIVVKFPGLKVVKAQFDSDNLEGGTADIEIDLQSIDSGIPKRDGHLASPDYFDVAKFPIGRILVREVKKKSGEVYSATAAVKIHGIETTWPVEFTVVERSEDGSVTIAAEHSFRRSDFALGSAEEDPAANDVSAKLKLTLTKS